MAQKTSQNIVPANLIGILPLQEAVLYPHTVIPLAVNRGGRTLFVPIKITG